MPPDVLIQQLLSALTSQAVEAILAKLPIASPEDYQWDYRGERLGQWSPGKLHWVPVGLDRGNSGRIKLAGEPMNLIAERTINGMEALIELARRQELIGNVDAPMPPSPREAVLRYFSLPRLDSDDMLDPDQKTVREHAELVRNRLSVHLKYSKPSKQFAVIVRDNGIGQQASQVHETLLSLGQTDKADKPYLIGVFGQGGSSTFAASQYSIIITRRAPELLRGDPDEIGWSIVRQIIPRHRRDPYYAYLAATADGQVPHFPTRNKDASFEHGTYFGHINYDFGGSSSAISITLYQSLNHALFNPILPYNLYAMKDKSDAMFGNAYRLARRVRQFGVQGTLDKSFPAQNLA